jgi:hypothetical protein
MEPSEAVANHVTAITTTTSEVGPGTSGTLQTPAGPITWTREAGGSLNAEGGGQQFTLTGTDDSDGSWQRNAAFSTAGAAPYLTIDAVTQNAQRSVATTVTAGQSQLTLTITGINAAVTSGTATVSGTLNGSAVNWTGPVDLTANPLTGNTVPGWPQGAFAAELQQASFFNPLVSTLAPPPPKPVAFPPAGSTGTGSAHAPADISPADVGQNLGAAASACIGGVVAGAKGGWWGIGLGCLGGAAGVELYSLWSWYTAPDPPLPPLPPPDPPVEWQSNYPPPPVDPPTPLPDPGGGPPIPTQPPPVDPPATPPPVDPPAPLPGPDGGSGPGSSTPDPPTGSDGTGSGAGAQPGSMEDPGNSGVAGGGSGEGPDGKPGLQPD